MSETIYLQHPLDQLTDPWLLRSLRAWRMISNTQGRFVMGDDLAPIFDSRGLLLPASTLLLVDGDNPLDYVVIWQGSLAQVGLGGNLIVHRWADCVDGRYAKAAATRVERAVAEAKIAYDEVWAEIDGQAYHYDRLALPVMWENNVELLLMIAKWRSPAIH